MSQLSQLSQLFEGYDDYRVYLQIAGKSIHTTRAYLLDLRAFAAWFRTSNGEDFSPRAVDPRDITDYRGYLLRTGLSSATINRRLISLRRFFKWAHRQRLVEESPFEVLGRVYVRDQSQQEIAPRWLDSNEQLALLRAVRKGDQTGKGGAGGAVTDGDGVQSSESGTLRELAIIQTLLGTGLRISELARLRLEDIEVSERKGLIRVQEGKGGKSRVVPLDNRTRSALLRYVEKRKKELQQPTPTQPSEQLSSARKKRSDNQSNQSNRQVEGPLFMGQRGPLNVRGVDYLVRKYAYQARLENCTAHTLRHTFAKNLVDAGTPLDQVAILLGHESLDTTRIYTKPSHRELERAVRRAAGEVPD